MIRKLIILLCACLCSQVLMISTSDCLQWPHPSSHLSSGYGYRIHPVSHKPRWHNGIDIPGFVKIKAVASGNITAISSRNDNNDGGNRITAAGWQYMHLPDSDLPNWEFGAAKGWNNGAYTEDIYYFAIQVGSNKVYYSTNSNILVGGIEKTASRTLTEGDFFAYTGNTGSGNKSGGTGVHLHLTNRNGGDPTKSPLLDLYNARKNDPDGYNPPENSQSPWILTPLFDSTTGIITAGISSASLGYPFEMDLNEFKIYTDNQLAHEISFTPRRNAKDENVSGGSKTGFYPTPAVGGLFMYYKLPTRTCSSNWPSSIKVAAKDAGDKTGERTLPIYSYPPLNCPGGDHPDDNFSVSDLTDLSPDEEYTGDPVWITPRIGILKDGFVPELGTLLDSRKIRYTFQPTDISALDLKNTDLVIIPSGGLHGLWNSDTFKKGLEDYVKAGGKVVVFAQQHGYEYSVVIAFAALMLISSRMNLQFSWSRTIL